MRTSDPLLDCAGVSAADLSAVLAIISGTDVSELDVTLGDTHLTLRRPASAAAPDAAPGTRPAPEARSLAITSPLVGIFHAAVSSGDSLQPGQSIGAVEALGMPTSVDAPQSGIVQELLVHDGSPVEYGQPLLLLQRSATSPPGPV